MKRLSRVSLFALCTVLAGPSHATHPALDAVGQPAKERIVVRTAAGGEHVFHVELAVSYFEILRGLTLRTELPADEGMLFVFPDSAERNFWMKNTLIPLDVLFLQGDGRISRIHHNAVPQDLSDIPSGGPVSRVLEINGGVARKLGIEEGDVVSNATFFSD